MLVAISPGEGYGPGDLSPCTLMFNSVNFASLDFGALEGTVVRGHAVNFAAP